MGTLRMTALVAAVLTSTGVSAADLSIVSTVAVQGILEHVRHDFEQSSGDHLNIRYGTSAALLRQLAQGAAFDVAILPPPLLNDLARQGKVVGSTFATVAKSGIGVAVKAGSVKPKIGTREELRAALLAAGTIAYTREGQSGAATARVLEALGITEALAGRIDLDPRPAGGLLAVAENNAILAFALLSEIAANPQVELVGPLPDGFQSFIRFSSGMSSDTKESDACREFIAFLGTTAVRRELGHFGMEGE
jgi:molybdate transport system substrate-binding protein